MWFVVDAREDARETRERHRGLIYPVSPLTTKLVLKACLEKDWTMVVVTGNDAVTILIPSVRVN